MTPSPQCMRTCARGVRLFVTHGLQPARLLHPRDTVMGARTQPGLGGGGGGNRGGRSQSSWGPQGLRADVAALIQVSGLL